MYPMPQLSKSRDQEEKYHAIFGEAAKHCRHLNREFDAEGWKRLLLDAFRGYRNFKRPFSRIPNVSDAARAVKRPRNP